MAAKRIGDMANLDLVPIMNLVTILIPFLLMSAQFVELAVIDTTLPAIAPEPVTAEPLDEDKLMLSVLVTGNGFTITGADKVLDPNDEANGPKVACIEAGCRTAESYDYRGLTERLTKVKDRWPNEENVILVPDGSIPYEVIVHTMDATRDDQQDRDGDNKPRLLFPNVVLAGGVN